MPCCWPKAVALPAWPGPALQHHQELVRNAESQASPPDCPHQKWGEAWSVLASSSPPPAQPRLRTSDLTAASPRRSRPNRHPRLLLTAQLLAYGQRMLWFLFSLNAIVNQSPSISIFWVWTQKFAFLIINLSH